MKNKINLLCELEGIRKKMIKRAVIVISSESSNRDCFNCPKTDISKKLPRFLCSLINSLNRNDIFTHFYHFFLFRYQFILSHTRGKIIFPLFIILVFINDLKAESIVYSPHNLSVSGTSEISSSNESEICIFCHAVHNGEGQTPLWNRYSGAVTYTTYGSPTMETQTQQPGSISKLCLSCHDGTIALGLVVSRENEITFPVGLSKIPIDNRSNLMDDLSDDHPMELDMTTHPAGEFVCTGCHDPQEFTDTENIECTSCHDPHDNAFGDFLVMNPTGGAICLQCHNISDWTNSSHALSTAQWNSSGADPWPNSDFDNVAQNACANCHVPHSAAGPWWLQKKNEEDLCLDCHTGNVAQIDIGSQILKPSAHNVSNYSGEHQPNEDPASMNLHVECSDCHNPHKAEGSASIAPDVSGPLKGVSGISASEQFVEEVNYGYEVCLKCHSNDLGGNYSNRQETLTIHEEFDISNISHHAVFGQGTGNAPSLIEPWATSRIVKCTDCHGNDSGSGDAHGSIYDPLLEKYIDTGDEHYLSTYNSANYALCFKCHDETFIKSASSFKNHNRHIRVSISCTTCHDPHGTKIYPHLLSFNTNIVTNINYIDDDPNAISGTCTMTCHGKTHTNKNY